MTVKELIEKLKEFDEDLDVGIGDHFDGTYRELDGPDLMKKTILIEGEVASIGWVRVW